MKGQREMQTELEKKITDTGLKPDNVSNTLNLLRGYFIAYKVNESINDEAEDQRTNERLNLLCAGATIQMSLFGISENDISIAQKVFNKELENRPVYIARAKDAERQRKRRAARTPEQIEADRAKARERMRRLYNERKRRAVADNQR